MKLKWFLGVFFSFVFFFAFSLPASATEPPIIGANLNAYTPPTGADCNINVPSQYTTIQSGIDAASDGDTVCVGPGTYNESVSINKSIRLSGRGASQSVINGQIYPSPLGYYSTVVFNANDITLEGFYIKGVNSVGLGFTITNADASGSGNKIFYNRILAGTGQVNLNFYGYQIDSLVQNNIFEGNNSPAIAVVSSLASNEYLDNVDFISNTFIGMVTEQILSTLAKNSTIKWNVFNTNDEISRIIYTFLSNTVTENNFNVNPTGLVYGMSNIKVINLYSDWVSAENNWWGDGDTDPSDNIIGLVDFTPFALMPFPEYSVVDQITSLSPAKVWIGLKNSDDVGLKFDLKAEVYKDDILVSYGELNSFPGGSSGFNNAHLATIPFNSFSPVDFPSGSQLKLVVYVRNACTGSRHNSGTARLWYNDSQANSQFDVTIGTTDNAYFLLDNFLLGTGPGSTKKTIDIAAGTRCSALKPFGTWIVTP